MASDELARSPLTEVKRLPDRARYERSEANAILDAELRQTTVLELAIDTASVKARTGGPLDEPEDMTLDTWAGVVPMTVEFGTPVRDDEGGAGVVLPRSLTPYQRPCPPARGPA